jgi:hypothetical protein
MSFDEEYNFDDSLDELLANITILDPNLKTKKEVKSVETQTDNCLIDNQLKTKPKINRKRRIRIIKTDKHHHKPCIYHQKNSSFQSNDSKRSKTQDIESNKSFNNENKIEITFNNNNNNTNYESMSHSNNSSQFQLITNQEFNSSYSSSQTLLNSNHTIDDNLSQNSIDLLSDSILLSSSESIISNKSFNLLRTDDESDGQRSPLHQLAIDDNNGLNDRQQPVIRSSQEQLITDEDFFKTQNSQNSNSSQNSSIFSFYEY